MQQLQIVFDRIQDTKSKIREIKRTYKDELEANHQYISATGQIKTLRAQKKQIEFDTQVGMNKAFDELATLQVSLKTDKELLTDISLTTYAESGKVEIKRMVGYGDHQTEETLLPEFSVKFKKA